MKALAIVPIVSELIYLVIEKPITLCIRTSETNNHMIAEMRPEIAAPNRPAFITRGTTSTTITMTRITDASRLNCGFPSAKKAVTIIVPAILITIMQQKIINIGLIAE